MPDRAVLYDILEPKGCYARSKATQAYRWEVFRGDIVIPYKCEEMIPDGRLVAVQSEMHAQVYLAVCPVPRPHAYIPTSSTTSLTVTDAPSITRYGTFHLSTSRLLRI